MNVSHHASSTPDLELALHIDGPYVEHVDVDRVRQMVVRTLAAQHISGPVELSVVITGDPEIQALNRRYRGVDAPTDVLAFGDNNEDAPFVTPAQERRYLGDIVISYPRVVAQAEKYGHTPHEELDLLIVHGCLHLLGFEDETEEGVEEMWRWQRTILGIYSPGPGATHFAG